MTLQVLLLDEPTSGLDASSSRDVIHTLRRLGHAGHTILVTIHQPRCEIFGEFDRLLLLHHGALLHRASAPHTASRPHRWPLALARLGLQPRVPPALARCSPQLRCPRGVAWHGTGEVAFFGSPMHGVASLSMLAGFLSADIDATLYANPADLLMDVLQARRPTKQTTTPIAPSTRIARPSPHRPTHSDRRDDAGGG